MIRITSRRSLLALTLGAACAAGSVAPALAQSSRNNQASSDVFKSEPVRTYNISFAGGTATEYIATVRKAHESVNIVELADVSRVILPRVEMHNVSLEQAVSILDGARSEVIDGVGIHLDVDVDHGNGTAPVFRVTADQFRGGHQRSMGTTTARIWSVSDLTKDDGGETLLNAIESALALKPAEETTIAPRVRYHRESGLLMARAYDEDLQAIEGVIVEMMRHTRQQRPSQEQGEIESLRIQLKNAKELADDRLDLVKKARAETGDVLRGEMDEKNQLRSALDECNMRFDEAQREAARQSTSNDLLKNEVNRLMDRIDGLTQQIIELKVKLGEKGG